MALIYLRIYKIQKGKQIDNKEQIKYSRGVERAKHFNGGRPPALSNPSPHPQLDQEHCGDPSITTFDSNF